MDRIVYSSPFLPAEWIAAHGLQPCRVTPRGEGAAAMNPGSGRCAYCRAFECAAEGAEAAAVIYCTECDQMRRAAELHARRGGQRVFLFNLPSTWETSAAKKIYLDELKRLGRFLETVGGRAPTREGLIAATLEWEEKRAALRGARVGKTARGNAQAIREFNVDGAIPAATNGSGCGHGVPLAIVGGPLLEEQFELFAVVERAGGTVVLNGTENGERGIAAAMEKSEVEKDAFDAMARAHFEGIADVRQRPNRRLFEWLKTTLDERGVAGVIVHRHSWCDLWHAEVERLRTECGRPLLDLEARESGRIDERSRTRLQSFIEMLQ